MSCSAGKITRQFMLRCQPVAADASVGRGIRQQDDLRFECRPHVSNLVGGRVSCETRTSLLGSVDGSGATHEHFTYMWIVSKEGLCRVSLLRNQFC